MGHKFFFIFFSCRLFLPHFPHLIIRSASPSSFFKQSLHVGIGTKIVNKDSVWTAIELGPPASESSTKISKFHAPTNSEHKFHKARIENWLPIEFKPGSPWLRIRTHNHQLGTCWVGVLLLGTRSSTTETVQLFQNPTPITQSGIGQQWNKTQTTLA